jgi:hypothetical protein
MGNDINIDRALSRLVGLPTLYAATMITMPEGLRDARAAAEKLMSEHGGDAAKAAGALGCSEDELRGLLERLRT